MVKFYFITISKCGDAIGASLLRTLKRKTHNVDYYGIGGSKMNLDTIIEYDKLHDNMYLSDDETKFSNKDYNITYDIMKKKPEVVITIGNWDFCKNIHKKINNSHHCGKVILIHYVAPNVFYKGDRFIKEMSEQIDFLISIYPQEANCASRYKLPCAYAGHPMMEIRCVNTNIQEFSRRIDHTPQKKILTVLLETNVSDIRRILPDILQVEKNLNSQNQNIEIIFLSSGSAVNQLQELLKKSLSKALVFDEEYDFDNVMAITKVAIATSEKSTLKASLVNIPHIVAYKEPITQRLKLGKSKQFHFLNLVNLILGKNIIPIYFNYNYNIKSILQSIQELLEEKELYKKQLTGFEDLRYILSNGKNFSSENAADAILNFVKGLMCVNDTCVYL
ncbi:MAG: hypothetical protein PHE89_00845 [Alphaproteobacteria bacterium]|nr:hypothetical protein [Alphaproteobacteria bacterium]